MKSTTGIRNMKRTRNKRRNGKRGYRKEETEAEREEPGN